MESTISLTVILILQLTSGGGRSIESEDQLEPYFPPARPSAENLHALCLHGNSRPRYPDSCIPPSAYGYVRRAGAAVNRAEAGFSQCCEMSGAQDQQVLCCVKQAWEFVLSQFCVEEFSTMTLAHECCEKKGEDRWSCFEEQAPNPSYQPLPGYTAPPVPSDMMFSWNHSTC